MTEKVEALRLAEQLEKVWFQHEAAAELRRLHDENKLLHQFHHDANLEYTRILVQRDALLEALQNLDANPELTSAWLQARAAIKMVEGK